MAFLLLNFKRAAKIRNIAVYQFFSSSMDIMVQTRVVSQQEVPQIAVENQSNSMKFVTTCDGHTDVMKNETVRYSLITLQNHMNFFRKEVDGHLQYC